MDSRIELFLPFLYRKFHAVLKQIFENNLPYPKKKIALFTFLSSIYMFNFVDMQVSYFLADAACHKLGTQLIFAGSKAKLGSNNFMVLTNCKMFVEGGI